MRSLYANSGPKAEGVPTNNQRGRGSGPWRLWGGLHKARHIVPTALLVRVQRLRNDLYKAVKGPSTRPIVPTNYESGRGSGLCRLWRGLDKARHIVPTALLVRVQRVRNDLYKAVKGPSTRPKVLSMIAG